MVSGPPALWQRPPRRFRTRPGADRGLDLRHGAHSRGYPLSAYDLPGISLGTHGSQERRAVGSQEAWVALRASRNGLAAESGHENVSKSTNHWCAHGPGPEPPRRGYGAFGIAWCRTAGGYKEARSYGGRHRESRSEAAGRDA